MFELVVAGEEVGEGEDEAIAEVGEIEEREDEDEAIVAVGEIEEREDDECVEFEAAELVSDEPAVVDTTAAAVRDEGIVEVG